MPRESRQLVVRLLTFCVVCQCLGNAWWFGVTGKTPLTSLAFSEPTSRAVHLSLAATWLIAAVAVAIRPIVPVLAGLTVLQLLIAAAMVNDGGVYSLVDSEQAAAVNWFWQGLPLLSQSARMAAPLTLAMLVYRASNSNDSDSFDNLALRCLRWATVATFAAHGVKALYDYPTYTELITRSSQRWLDTTFSGSSISFALTIIGTVDVAVALLLVFRQSRKTVAYMAAWGLITALSRLTAYGLAAGLWGVVTRAPHFALPFVLWICWKKTSADTSTSAAKPEPN